MRLLRFRRLMPHIADSIDAFEYLVCRGLVFVDIGDDRANGLWNPATKEYKILPKATTPVGFDRNYDGLLTSYGFGYDCKINDYKVVRIASPDDIDHTLVFEVEVYTLGSDSWRIIKDAPCKITGSSSGVFMNGAPHWLTNPYPSRSDSKFSQVLLSFNMSGEVFNELPYLVIFEKFEHKRMDTLGGLLCMLCSSTVGFEVWVMSDCGVGAFGPNSTPFPD